MTPSLVRGSSKDDLSPTTPPQQTTCLARAGSASDTCGRGHVESPPWKLTSLKTFQEESIQRPSSSGRTCPVNHLSLFYPMYHLCDCPQFQSQSHVDRQQWLTFYPPTYSFNPLDFNPIKAPVIAQSSGKTTNQPLYHPLQRILYSYLLFYIILDVQSMYENTILPLRDDHSLSGLWPRVPQKSWQRPATATI